MSSLQFASSRYHGTNRPHLSVRVQTQGELMRPPTANRKLSDGIGPSLAQVTTATRKLPNRVILHGVEGWGKTSFAAQAPKPIFLMTRGEDGLETLIDSGQL